MSKINEAKVIARLKGFTKYIGLPCKRGHDGVRYVANSACVECNYRKKGK